MDKKKIGVLAGVVIAAGVTIYLVYRLVAGLLGLMTSAADLMIGLIVVLVLAVIVIWMFSYARHHRK